MNINRNNYEEYFLLYADNELTAAERKMVEVFVKENPDLREEFCMFKLTISIPEDITLNDKSFLMKKETSFINEENYEEIFVLYHDNELTEKEKLETGNFVAEHPNVKTEFDLIEKAKLSPDSLIVYPDKKELYHKEKSGRVISMMLWRYIAAAVLIGFGLWFSVPYFTNHETKVPVTAQNIPIKKPHAATPGIAPVEPKQQADQVASSGEDKVVKDFPKEEEKVDRKDVKITKQLPMVKTQVKTETPSLVKQIQQLKNEPVDVIALKSRIDNNQQNIDYFKKPIQDEAKAAIQKPGQEVQPNYSQTAGYTDATSSNDNYVFYDVPAEQFNKTKVGGFLKKVKRIVERTNPITRLLEGNEEPVVAQKF